MAGPIRILIIDDDERLQRAMKRAAETAGYEVEHAFNGSDGLTLAAKEKFDLILLDINMPTMDGRDVLSRLKQNAETSNIPVLVCSARSGQLDRHLGLELGADDYIDKPMDANLLMGKIARIIARVARR
jgi:DNA-binding response OmpR family regulator